ncbi:AAEL004946-PA, partial [Aedes aegypti]
VKQERHDEAEINELAAKMMEVHKQQTAKAALQQQQVVRPGGAGQVPGVTANGTTGQTNILNYLTRKPGQQVPQSIGATTIAPVGSAQTNGNAAKTEETNGEKKACDEESQKGHFGWETFPGKIHIPYIFRQSERYCAVRMVEMKLLNKYLNYLHQDIYSCTCVRSYYITDAESKLFNEINTKHCDFQFGREMFTLKDLVVRLSDAYKFYQFLDVCYKKLLMGCSTPNDKCGFIRINKESVVPYTVRDNQKMVPLFYFEGETDNLKLKADYLSGWDLSYLKFCCKVQGIRNELFASDSVAVISLTDIKGYFPPGTEFEDYWPSKVVDSQLLSGPKSNNTVHWTRQPAQPPPKQPTNMMNTMAKQQPQVRKTANNMYQALQQQQQQNLQKNNAQMPNISAAVQALTNNWNLTNHANLLSAAQQEQLLRITQAQQAAQAQAQIRSMQNMHPMQYNSYMNQTMSMTSRSSQNQAVPPPLVRSSQSQAAHMSNMAGAAAAAAMSQQQQQQQKRSNAAAAAAMTNGRSNTTITSTNNYRSTAAVLQQQLQQQQAAVVAAQQQAAAMSADGGTRHGNMIMLPEMTMGGTPYKPYEVVKKPIENKTIYCINKTPYRNTDYLMTIQDLKDVFFPYISLEVCRRVLNALDINLFVGNSLQYQALLEAGRANVDKMPLVQVVDVMQFMPQLQYMVRGQIGQETPANKRARIS